MVSDLIFCRSPYVLDSTDNCFLRNADAILIECDSLENWDELSQSCKKAVIAFSSLRRNPERRRNRNRVAVISPYMTELLGFVSASVRTGVGTQLISTLQRPDLFRLAKNGQSALSSHEKKCTERLLTPSQGTGVAVNMVMKPLGRGVIFVKRAEQKKE